MSSAERSAIVLCPHCDEEQEVGFVVRKTVCRACGKLIDTRENTVPQFDGFWDEEEDIIEF